MSEFPGEFNPVKLIYKGAEAELWLGDFLGIRAVLKKRIRKSYRLKELDEELVRSRTIREASLLHEVKKAGVKAPFVLHVNPNKFWIITSFVDGKNFSEILFDEFSKEISKKVGESICLMHMADIFHGDLTPSNIIVFNNEPYFLDFGLGGKSTEIEKFAEDLNVFRKSLQSKMGEKFTLVWDEVLTGYKEKGKKFSEEVLLRLREIDKRGRYKRRTEK